MEARGCCIISLVLIVIVTENPALVIRIDDPSLLHDGIFSPLLWNIDNRYGIMLHPLGRRGNFDALVRGDGLRGGLAAGGGGHQATAPYCGW